MFCMRCGTMLPNDATFCFKCGFQINNSVKDQFGSKRVYDPRKDASFHDSSRKIEEYHNDGMMYNDQRQQFDLEFQKLLSQKTTFTAIMIILMVIPFICLVHAFFLWNSEKAELAILLDNLAGGNETVFKNLFIDCLISSLGLIVGFIFLADIYIIKTQKPALSFGCFVLFDYWSTCTHLFATILVNNGTLKMGGELGKTLGLAAFCIGLLYLVFMIWGCIIVKNLKKAGFFPSKTVNS